MKRTSFSPQASPDELTVDLQSMKRRHLRQVLRIEEMTYPRPWSFGLFLGELALKATRHYVVARVDNQVVGYGGLMWMDTDTHVTNIAVDPAWQQHAIGSRIMLNLAKKSLRWGCSDITLEVRQTNVAAQRLYFKFGFAPEGVRKAYYIDNKEDALILWARNTHTVDYVARLAAIERSIPGRTLVDPTLLRAVAQDDEAVA